MAVPLRVVPSPTGLPTKQELTEDEMVGWHNRLNRHEFEQTVGDSEGQGSLGCPVVMYGCESWIIKKA